LAYLKQYRQVNGPHLVIVPKVIKPRLNLRLHLDLDNHIYTIFTSALLRVLVYKFYVAMRCVVLLVGRLSAMVVCCVTVLLCRCPMVLSVCAVCYVLRVVLCAVCLMLCYCQSTSGNWVREFKRWCPSLSLLLFHGSKDERALLREKVVLVLCA
jgi:hypothetical protein